MRSTAALVTLALATAACGRGAPATAGSVADTLSLAERRSIPGRIAFVSERDGNAEVYLTSPDGGEVRRLTTDPSADFPAAVSPDGRSLLVVSAAEDPTAGQQERMRLFPLDGGSAREVGWASARARSPSWSPDGKWLVFESDRRSFRDLFRATVGGGDPQRLTDNAQGNFEPDVSPDGSQVAFVSSRDGDAEVYVMPAAGGAARRITAYHRDDWAPRWSPDGRTIAFMSNREGSDRIFLVGADGGGLRRLTPANAPAGDSAFAEGDLAWSPDGARIAYVARQREGKAILRVADARTGVARDLTDGKADAGNPAWAPDGKHLVFFWERDGDAELYLAREDGSGVTRFTRSRGADWLPRWIKP